MKSHIKGAAELLEHRCHFVVFTFGLKYTKNVQGIWKKKLSSVPKDWEKFTLETPVETRVKNTKSHNALAIVTGKHSHLFVLDIDDITQWEHYLSDVKQEEPITVTQQTGSGGRHLFFKYTDNLKDIKSSSRMILHNGKSLDIDVRTTGGMIICAPTQCEVDNSIREYKWLPGKSPFDLPLAEVPDWLVDALCGTNKLTKPKTSTPVKDQVKLQSDGLLSALGSFLFDQYGILQTKEAVKYYPESEYYTIQTSSKLCPFVKREHSSNHQYCVIKKDGTIVRKCHSKSEECKDQEYKPVKVPPALFELIEKECKGDTVSSELIELACQEGSGHVMEVHGRSTALVPNIDRKLIGELSKLICMECGKTNLQVILGAEGSQVSCHECGALHPKRAMPYDLSKNFNLQKYMNVVFNIQTNHINNYYGSSDELTIGWNQFVDDPIKVHLDQITNVILLKAMSGTHSRIADLFSHLYKEKLVHCEDVAKPWYLFDYGWKNVDDSAVKQLLRSDDFLEYFVKVQKAIKENASITNSEAKVKQISSVLTKLETDGFQSSVLHQCESMLKKTKFLQKLNKDRSVLGFDNGLYDLTEGIFRPYSTDDLVTLSVGYDYDEMLMYHDENAIQEINRFMFSVFPDPETCKYVIKFLASCLAGYTDDQLFHFGFGSGSNGKGVLIKLVMDTLGDYAGTLAASFLTGTTPDADSPTPALTNIVGKRFVAISETVEGAKINEQLFKSMCGQDKLIYRPMRQEAREFEPDFKLFMVCNDLPEFKSDFAMQRRVRVIPFKSSFKDTPDKSKGEKKIDKSLNNKVNGWKYAFMGLLLQGYHLYLEEALVPSNDIREATGLYHNENNKCAMFLIQTCVKKPGSSILVTDLADRFKLWLEKNYDNQSTLSGPVKRQNKLTATLATEPWLITKKQEASLQNRWCFTDIAYV